MEKLTIRDFDPAGKRVLVRVDFNVPIEDGKVKDETRVRAALPTIRYLLARNAAVVLMSHLGRPNGKVVESARLRPVAQRLGELLRMSVPVTGDALGLGTRDAVMRLKPGQVLMLENVRFHAAEETNDAEYAKTLASYGEIYVNDAFGSAHRAHASTVGIAAHLPAYAGLLMEAELKALSKLLESPSRPFAAVIGGAKVSSKLAVLENLLSKVDVLLIGGGMANTFLVAQGHTVGKSLLERDLVPEAQRILEVAQRRKVELLLPSDVVVAKEVTRGAEHKIVSAHKIPNSWSVVDIGPAATKAFTDALEPAQTVLWNGPLGVFEVPTFGDGTRAMARYLARRAEAGASVIVGGGDSAAAVEELGLTGNMTHVSTGGGASLEFLEGRELPGVAVLLDRPVEKPVAPAKPAKVAAQLPVKAAPKPVARPAPKAAPEPAAPATPLVRAAAKAPARPLVMAAAKAPVTTAPKPTAKVATKAVAKAPTKAVAKAPAKARPAAKPKVKAAAKPVRKPSAKPVAKAKVKPAPKMTAKPSAKAAARAKAAAKPAAKTRAKPAARAVIKRPSKPAPTKHATRAAPRASAKVATRTMTKPRPKATAKPKAIAKAKATAKPKAKANAAPKPAARSRATAPAKPVRSSARPTPRRRQPAATGHAKATTAGRKERPL